MTLVAPQIYRSINYAGVHFNFDSGRGWGGSEKSRQEEGDHERSVTRQIRILIFLFRPMKAEPETDQKLPIIYELCVIDHCYDLGDVANQPSL